MRSQTLDTIRLQLLPLFHTDEDAKSIALRAMVSPKSIRKWWTEEFGQKAVATRGRRILVNVNQSRGYVFGEPKKCPRCKTIKTNFRPSSKNPNRPRPWCSDCEAEESARYRATRTPEQRLERAAYTKVQNARYYAEHAEESREYSRQYRESHPGVGVKEKRYYRAYPEKLLLKNAKQRALRFGLPFNITVEDVLKCTPQDGRCPITMELFEKGEGKLCFQSMSLDRIIPALGYVPGNIGVISHLANAMKQDCVNSEVFRRMAVWLVDPQLSQSQESSTQLQVPRYLIKGARQRAKKAGLLFTLTRDDIQALVPSDGRCPITRQPFVRGVGKVGPQSMSLDRLNQIGRAHV